MVSLWPGAPQLQAYWLQELARFQDAWVNQRWPYDDELMHGDQS